jgi:sugar phosphate isomerase/epimerase
VISDDRCERALRYLAETDEEAAELKANVERCEFKAKQVKASVFLHFTGTVGEREAEALTGQRTTAAYEEYFKAIRDYQAVANKRALQVLIVEVWRSLQANRRVGNV